MALRSYREIDSWKGAMDLVEAVYAMTRRWPDSERFGLTSQAQRAAVSVPANIAEGYGRAHRREYVRHLSIARGSLLELETHLLIAVRVGLVDREALRPVWRLAQSIGRMLSSQMTALRRLLREDGPASPDTPYPRPYTPTPSANA